MTISDDYYNSENWKTLPKHKYKPRELWFPMSEVVNLWEDEFHQLLLHDHIRMDAFQRAIKQVVNHLLKARSSLSAEPLRILDIGTGYGILAFWAVEAARTFKESRRSEPIPTIRVYATEANPATEYEACKRLDEKGMLWTRKDEPGDILVFNTSSYRLNEILAENSKLLREFDPWLWDTWRQRNSFKAFDMIISETLGAIGDSEDVVSILDHAIAEFLKEDGIVIPSRLTSLLVPIESTDGQANTVGEEAEGQKMGLHGQVAHRAYRKISDCYELSEPADPFNMFYDAIIPLSDYLGPECPIREWRFDNSPASHETLVTQYSEQRTFRVVKSVLSLARSNFKDAGPLAGPFICSLR